MSNFLENGLGHDKRVETISVYLVMLVLFTTSLKSFFPDSTNPDDIAGLNSFVRL